MGRHYLEYFRLSLSNDCNSFEDRSNVYFIYGFPTFKWIAWIWLHDKLVAQHCRATFSGHYHDDVIKWNRIHWSPVDSPHKRPVMFSLMFSLIYALKQTSNRPWFETPSRSLWHHCNDKRTFPTRYQCRGCSCCRSWKRHSPPPGIVSTRRMWIRIWNTRSHRWLSLDTWWRWRCWWFAPKRR